LIKEFGTLIPDGTPVTLGIDQSYSGFAVTAFSPKSEEFFTQVYKAENSGVIRLVNIRIFLTDFINKFNVEDEILDVAMEGYAYRSIMAHMLGELGAIVKLTCYENIYGVGAHPLIVSPPMLKKYVSGKGSGIQKNQMLLYMYKKWNVEFSDDNAADSYALARIAAGKQDFEYEKEIINKLKDPKYRET
jgi:hypothetical protein